MGDSDGPAVGQDVVLKAADDELPNRLQMLLETFGQRQTLSRVSNLERYLRGTGEFHVHLGVATRHRREDQFAGCLVVRHCLQVRRADVELRDDSAAGND